MALNTIKSSSGVTLTPQSAPPANPQNGDIYYDSGLNKLQAYQNGAWGDLGAGSGATGVQGVTGIAGVNGATGIQGTTGIEGPITSFKTANYTAVVNDFLGVDTSAGPFTVTLPATPSPNNQVRFADMGGALSVNNLTINGNGSNILGSASNFVADTNNIDFSVIYYNATRGWVVVN